MPCGGVVSETATNSATQLVLFLYVLDLYLFMETHSNTFVRVSLCFAEGHPSQQLASQPDVNGAFPVRVEMAAGPVVEGLDEILVRYSLLDLLWRGLEKILPRGLQSFLLGQLSYTGIYPSCSSCQGSPQQPPLSGMTLVTILPSYYCYCSTESLLLTLCASNPPSQVFILT